MSSIIEIANRLDENYQMILVGTNEEVDCILPDSIISIHRTSNKQELAEAYSAADIFLQTTEEETFGIVNVEALACGTPVITFNTGGSPEAIDESCGCVVEQNDVDAMIRAIEEQVKTRKFTSEACVKRAEEFDEKIMYERYIELYAQLIDNRI